MTDATPDPRRQAWLAANGPSFESSTPALTSDDLNDNDARQRRLADAVSVAITAQHLHTSSDAVAAEGWGSGAHTTGVAGSGAVSVGGSRGPTPNRGPTPPRAMGSPSQERMAARVADAVAALRDQNRRPNSAGTPGGPAGLHRPPSLPQSRSNSRQPSPAGPPAMATSSAGVTPLGRDDSSRQQDQHHQHGSTFPELSAITAATESSTEHRDPQSTYHHDHHHGQQQQPPAVIGMDGRQRYSAPTRGGSRSPARIAGPGRRRTGSPSVTAPLPSATAMTGATSSERAPTTAAAVPAGARPLSGRSGLGGIGGGDVDLRGLTTAALNLDGVDDKTMRSAEQLVAAIAALSAKVGSVQTAAHHQQQLSHERDRELDRLSEEARSRDATPPRAGSTRRHHRPDYQSPPRTSSPSRAPLVVDGPAGTSAARARLHHHHDGRAEARPPLDSDEEAIERGRHPAVVSTADLELFGDGASPDPRRGPTTQQYDQQPRFDSGRPMTTASGEAEDPRGFSLRIEDSPASVAASPPSHAIPGTSRGTSGAAIGGVVSPLQRPLPQSTSAKPSTTAVPLATSQLSIVASVAHDIAQRLDGVMTTLSPVNDADRSAVDHDQDPRHGKSSSASTLPPPPTLAATAASPADVGALLVSTMTSMHFSLDRMAEVEAAATATADTNTAQASEIATLKARLRDHNAASSLAHVNASSDSMPHDASTMSANASSVVAGVPPPQETAFMTIVDILGGNAKDLLEAYKGSSVSPLPKAASRLALEAVRERETARRAQVETLRAFEKYCQYVNDSFAALGFDNPTADEASLVLEKVSLTSLSAERAMRGARRTTDAGRSPSLRSRSADASMLTAASADASAVGQQKSMAGAAASGELELFPRHGSPSDRAKSERDVSQAQTTPHRWLSEGVMPRIDALSATITAALAAAEHRAELLASEAAITAEVDAQSPTPHSASAHASGLPHSPSSPSSPQKAASVRRKIDAAIDKLENAAVMLLSEHREMTNGALSSGHADGTRDGVHRGPRESGSRETSTSSSSDSTAFSATDNDTKTASRTSPGEGHGFHAADNSSTAAAEIAAQKAALEAAVASLSRENARLAADLAQARTRHDAAAQRHTDTTHQDAAAMAEMEEALRRETQAKEEAWLELKHRDRGDPPTPDPTVPLPQAIDYPAVVAQLEAALSAETASKEELWSVLQTETAAKEDLQATLKADRATLDDLQITLQRESETKASLESALANRERDVVEAQEAALCDATEVQRLEAELAKAHGTIDGLREVQARLPGLDTSSAHHMSPGAGSRVSAADTARASWYNPDPTSPRIDSADAAAGGGAAEGDHGSSARHQSTADVVSTPVRITGGGNVGGDASGVPQSPLGDGNVISAEVLQDCLAMLDNLLRLPPSVLAADISRHSVQSDWTYALQRSGVLAAFAVSTPPLSPTGADAPLNSSTMDGDGADNLSRRGGEEAAMIVTPSSTTLQEAVDVLDRRMRVVRQLIGARVTADASSCESLSAALDNATEALGHLPVKPPTASVNDDSTKPEEANGATNGDASAERRQREEQEQQAREEAIAHTGSFITTVPMTLPVLCEPSAAAAPSSVTQSPASARRPQRHAGSGEHASSSAVAAAVEPRFAPFESEEDERLYDRTADAALVRPIDGSDDAVEGQRYQKPVVLSVAVVDPARVRDYAEGRVAAALDTLVDSEEARETLKRDLVDALENQQQQTGQHSHGMPNAEDDAEETGDGIVNSQRLRSRSRESGGTGRVDRRSGGGDGSGRRHGEVDSDTDTHMFTEEVRSPEDNPADDADRLYGANRGNAGGSGSRHHGPVLSVTEERLRRRVTKATSSLAECCHSSFAAVAFATLSPTRGRRSLSPALSESQTSKHSLDPAALAVTSTHRGQSRSPVPATPGRLGGSNAGGGAGGGLSCFSSATVHTALKQHQWEQDVLVLERAVAEASKKIKRVAQVAYSERVRAENMRKMHTAATKRIDTTRAEAVQLCAVLGVDVPATHAAGLRLQGDMNGVVDPNTNEHGNALGGSAPATPSATSRRRTSSSGPTLGEAAEATGDMVHWALTLCSSAMDSALETDLGGDLGSDLGDVQDPKSKLRQHLKGAASDTNVPSDTQPPDANDEAVSTQQDDGTVGQDDQHDVVDESMQRRGANASNVSMVSSLPALSPGRPEMPLQSGAERQRGLQVARGAHETAALLALIKTKDEQLALREADLSMVRDDHDKLERGMVGVSIRLREALQVLKTVMVGWSPALFDEAHDEKHLVELDPRPHQDSDNEADSDDNNEDQESSDVGDDDDDTKKKSSASKREKKKRRLVADTDVLPEEDETLGVLLATRLAGLEDGLVAFRTALQQHCGLLRNVARTQQAQALRCGVAFAADAKAGQDPDEHEFISQLDRAIADAADTLAVGPGYRSGSVASTTASTPPPVPATTTPSPVPPSDSDTAVDAKASTEESDVASTNRGVAADAAALAGDVVCDHRLLRVAATVQRVWRTLLSLTETRYLRPNTEAQHMAAEIPDVIMPCATTRPGEAVPHDTVVRQLEGAMDGIDGVFTSYAKQHKLAAIAMQKDTDKLQSHLFKMLTIAESLGVDEADILGGDGDGDAASAAPVQAATPQPSGRQNLNDAADTPSSGQTSASAAGLPPVSPAASALKAGGLPPAAPAPGAGSQRTPLRRGDASAPPQSPPISPRVESGQQPTSSSEMPQQQQQQQQQPTVVQELRFILDPENRHRQRGLYFHDRPDGERPAPWVRAGDTLTQILQRLADACLQWRSVSVEDGRTIEAVVKGLRAGFLDPVRNSAPPTFEAEVKERFDDRQAAGAQGRDRQKGGAHGRSVSVSSIDSTAPWTEAEVTAALSVQQHRDHAANSSTGDDEDDGGDVVVSSPPRDDAGDNDINDGGDGTDGGATKAASMVLPFSKAVTADAYTMAFKLREDISNLGPVIEHVASSAAQADLLRQKLRALAKTDEKALGGVKQQRDTAESQAAVARGQLRQAQREAANAQKEAAEVQGEAARLRVALRNSERLRDAAEADRDEARTAHEDALRILKEKEQEKSNPSGRATPRVTPKRSSSGGDTGVVPMGRTGSPSSSRRPGSTSSPKRYVYERQDSGPPGPRVARPERRKRTPIAHAMDDEDGDAAPGAARRTGSAFILHNQGRHIQGRSQAVDLSDESDHSSEVDDSGDGAVPRYAQGTVASRAHTGSARGSTGDAHDAAAAAAVQHDRQAQHSQGQGQVQRRGQHRQQLSTDTDDDEDYDALIPAHPGAGLPPSRKDHAESESAAAMSLSARAAAQRELDARLSGQSQPTSRPASTSRRGSPAVGSAQGGGSRGAVSPFRRDEKRVASRTPVDEDLNAAENARGQAAPAAGRRLAPTNDRQSRRQSDVEQRSDHRRILNEADDDDEEEEGAVDGRGGGAGGVYEAAAAAVAAVMGTQRNLHGEFGGHDGRRTPKTTPSKTGVKRRAHTPGSARASSASGRRGTATNTSVASTSRRTGLEEPTASSRRRTIDAGSVEDCGRPPARCSAASRRPAQPEAPMSRGSSRSTPASSPNRAKPISLPIPRYQTQAYAKSATTTTTTTSNGSPVNADLQDPAPGGEHDYVEHHGDEHDDDQEHFHTQERDDELERQALRTQQGLKRTKRSVPRKPPSGATEGTGAVYLASQQEELVEQWRDTVGREIAERSATMLSSHSLGGASSDHDRSHRAASASSRPAHRTISASRAAAPAVAATSRKPRFTTSIGGVGSGAPPTSRVGVPAGLRAGGVGPSSAAGSRQGRFDEFAAVASPLPQRGAFAGLEERPSKAGNKDHHHHQGVAEAARVKPVSAKVHDDQPAMAARKKAAKAQSTLGNSAVPGRH